jgi:putative transcriptional regulator
VIQAARRHVENSQTKCWPARTGNRDIVTVHQTEMLNGRPLDMLLAGYAAGSLNAPLHALVGSHLALSPQNRAFVSALEGAAATAALQATEQPLSARDAMLAAILSEDESPMKPPVLHPDPVFPAPLARLVGPSDALRWRFKLPGVKEYRVAETDGGEAVLYWVKAGRALPQHTHEGDEVTLLLKGGFTDPLGHYRRGDIAIGDDELDHTPVADRDEDCICFAVTDAPLRLTGPVMRLLRKVFQG